MTASRLVPRFDPLDGKVIADPYLQYAALRRDAPVCRGGPGTWMVFSYAQVASLLVDPRLGNERAAEPGSTPLFGAGPSGQLSQRIIAGRDGAAHAMLRRLLTPALSGSQARCWLPRVRAMVADLLAPALDGEVLDAVSELAFPLQSLIVCELLGLPTSERDRIWPLAVELGRTFIPYRLPAAEQTAHADLAVTQLRGVISEWFDRRHHQPSDDLLGLFAGADGDSGLTREDLVDNLVFLLFAGFEPTMNMLGNGLAALLAHPGEWARLHDDETLLPTAIEEFLRYDAPTQYTMRLVLSPIDLADRSLRPGRLLLLVLGSANRDESQFPQADRLDVGRQPNHHLSFGAGKHHCTGRALAQVVGGAVFGYLREHASALEPAGPAERLDHPNFRAHRTLPMQLRA